MSKKVLSPKPQLLQPRTMRFAADEICATLLRIAPVGQYDPWADYKPAADGEILRVGVFERIMAFTATLTAPAYRGREWAIKQASEAKGQNK